MGSKYQQLLDRFSDHMIPPLAQIVMDYLPFLKNLKCHLCKSSLHLLDDGYEFAQETQIIWSISCDHAMLCCANCETYYMPCDKCSEEYIDENDIPVTDAYIVLCQFMGYGSYNEDSSEDEESGCRRGNESGNYDRNGPRYNYALKDNDYVHIPDINRNEGSEGITGANGGESHWWKCRECGYHFSETDK